MSPPPAQITTSYKKEQKTPNKYNPNWGQEKIKSPEHKEKMKLTKARKKPNQT